MTDKRPNILFITADQWRGDSVGVAGNPVIRTPAFDALAEEGCVFLNHYAAATPCAPARASIYTGLQQANHRVINNGTPLAGRFDNIARAARRVGYLPTLFGYTDQSADPNDFHPNDPALKTYEGVLPGFEVGQALTEAAAPWRRWLKGQGYDAATCQDPYDTPLGAAAPFAAEHSQTAFLAGRFLEWIDEQPEDQPWFAHVSFLHPHPPFVASAPYHALYAPENMPEPVGFSAETRYPVDRIMAEQQRAKHFHPSLEGWVGDLSPAELLRIKAIYYGLISEVDAQIGRIFAALDAAGHWQNTIVVLTSDHGEMMGDRGLLGKGGIFPQSYHTPLAIKVPGQPGGQRVDALSSAVDLFPTLCDLIGVTPTNAVNGRSLLSYLQGAAPPRPRESVIWEYYFGHHLDDAELQTAGRQRAQAKFMVRRSEDALYAVSPYLPPSYFDLRDDPDCLHDLADDASRVDDRLKLAETFLAERMSLDDETLAAIALV